MDNTDSTDRQKHANPGGHTGGDITQPFADANINGGAHAPPKPEPKH